MRPSVGKITRGFIPGEHSGIDFGWALLQPDFRIRAALSGTVTEAGWDEFYGNHVRILHTPTLRTFYAHLKSISVVPGQHVLTLQPIGVMGSTGEFAKGRHLHFGREVATRGQWAKVDPAPLLTATSPAGDTVHEIIQEGSSDMLLFNGVSVPGQFYIATYDGATLKCRPTLGVEAKALLAALPQIPRVQLPDADLVELCRQGGYVAPRK